MQHKKPGKRAWNELCVHQPCCRELRSISVEYIRVHYCTILCAGQACISKCVTVLLRCHAVMTPLLAYICVVSVAPLARNAKRIFLDYLARSAKRFFLDYLREPAGRANYFILPPRASPGTQTGRSESAFSARTLGLPVSSSGT